MSLDNLMNNTGSVYTVTITQSESAGMKRTRNATAKASNRPCRVQDASADQKSIALARNLVITHVIFTKYSGTVNGDEWLIGTRVFRVEAIEERRPIGNMEGFFVIGAQEIQN